MARVGSTSQSGAAAAFGAIGAGGMANWGSSWSGGAVEKDGLTGLRHAPGEASG
jgi:hypothetical protein